MYIIWELWILFGNYIFLWHIKTTFVTFRKNWMTFLAVVVTNVGPFKFYANGDSFFSGILLLNSNDGLSVCLHLPWTQVKASLTFKEQELRQAPRRNAPSSQSIEFYLQIYLYKSVNSCLLNPNDRHSGIIRRRLKKRKRHFSLIFFLLLFGSHIKHNTRI